MLNNNNDFQIEDDAIEDEQDIFDEVIQINDDSGEEVVDYDESSE